MANTVNILENTLKVLDDHVDVDCSVDGTIVHVHVWKSHLTNTAQFPGNAAQKKEAWRQYIADEAIKVYLKLNPPTPSIDITGPPITK